MGKVLLLGCLTLALAGCASPERVATIPPGTGERVIEMRASNFAFDPNVIQGRQGDEILLLIENASAFEHNITVVSPSGETLIARDLPAGRTVPVKLTLTEAGEYAFHCDKPMHPRFGMTGRFEVR